DVAACLLSFMDAMVPLLEPLFVRSLTGEASNSVVPVTAVTTALLTTFVQTSIVPLVSWFEACVVNLRVVIFFHFSLLLAARIVSCSILSSSRSRLISKASSLCVMYLSAVLNVGMPIFAGMTASILYVSENGVSSLLDLIIVRMAMGTRWGSAFVTGSLAQGDEPSSLDIPLSFFLHPHALLASSILSVKLVDVILLRASAFLFSLLNTCFIKNFLKFTANALTFSRFISIKPALKPSTQDDPSVNNVHGFESPSFASMGVSNVSSSGRSTMKSTKICPLTDVLSLYCMSYSPSSILYFCILSAISGFDSIYLIGWSVMTIIDAANKIDWHFLSLPVRHQDCTHSFLCCRKALISCSSVFQTKRHFRVAEYPLACDEGSTNFSTSSYIALFLYGAWPLFFCLTGEHPSRTFNLCSAMCCGTPVISAGFQVNMSRSRLSRSHNAFWPSAVRVEPIAIVCSRTDICPIGHMVSPLNLTRGTVAGTICLFTFEWSLLKQCSYSIFEADPPSTYIRCMKWPPISDSMIIGPFVPSLLYSGGNGISESGKKLYVIFFLANLGHGWTIRNSRALSFLEECELVTSPFGPLLVPEVSFSVKVLFPPWFMLFPCRKFFLSRLIRGCHLSPEEHCGYPHYLIHRLWDITVHTFNEFRVGDSVHESEDSHSFQGSFHMPTFSLEPFHKVFQRVDTFLALPPNLSNTHPFLLPLSSGLCLGDLDLPHFILEETLLLLVTADGSICHNIPEGLRRTRAYPGFYHFLSPLCVRTVDVVGVGTMFAGSLMWDPCRARIRGNRDCGRRYPTAGDLR
nr:hypothetical protein [Tanacetum cinerariifolium]